MKVKFEFGHTPLSFDRVMAPFLTQNPWKFAEALGKPNGIYVYSTWKLAGALGKPNSIFWYSKNPKGAHSKGCMFFIRVNGYKYYLLHRHIIHKTKLKFEFGHTPSSFDRVMAPFLTQNPWKVAEALGSPNGIYLYSTWK